MLLAAPGWNASAVAADSSAVSSASAGGYEDHSTFLSPEKTAPMPFTGLGVKWHEIKPAGTTADLSVRFKEGGIWSEWSKLSTEADTQNNIKENFIAVNETNTFQYKVFLQSFQAGVTPVIENPEFTYINAREQVGAVSEKLVASIGTVSQDLQARSGSVVGTNIKIISRSEWGADESLRVLSDDRPTPQLVKLDSDFYVKYADELKLSARITQTPDGKTLTWPLEYAAKVSKIIIHHTATTKDLDDPQKAIRDIYYYHTISKGW
jgi:hypothetical protein